MQPDLPVPALPGGPRGRLARLAQAMSVVAFVAAAAAMLLAGAVHSAGQPATSTVLATLGYALGVAGIAAGVLALTLDPHKETP